MAQIINGTVTVGGTAQDILANGNQYGLIRFQNRSANKMTLQVDGTAAAGSGEDVASNASIVLQVYGKRVSLLGTTTADPFAFEDTTAQHS